MYIYIYIYTCIYMSYKYKYKNICIYLYTGMAVIQRLGCVTTGANDRPLADVKIFKARIRETKLLQ
jgi:hypothetical protein